MNRFIMTLALLATMFASSNGQTNQVQGGIFNPIDSTLSVRARPTVDFGSPNILSNIVVTIRWLSSYGVSLGSVSSPTYGITKQGSEGTSGSYRYQIFGAANNTALNWTANNEVELFTVTVNQTGSGTGVFELTNVITNGEWYVEISSVDVTNPTFYQASAGGVPLPVQLVYFTGSIVNNGRHVDLRWGTLTELNNYGFFVQKSPLQPDAYETIPNSFVPGHGTTLVPQHYAFTDSLATPGVWYYRLKQVDLDGTIHYNEGIRIDIVTGVDDPAPREFALMQNYPNPFNPRAEIKFSVETTERATLRIYDLIGQHVATLFDDIAEAGRYYRVTVDGTPLASGMYFYKLETATRSAIRKMMLVK